MKHLNIGARNDGTAFNLPLELVTQSIAILAKRGVGKTYTAAVFCEELLAAGQVPVVIDPTGAHWGIKGTADGKSSGFPVVIFGGEHADLPLEEGSGEAIARAIVEQRFPAIIDLSLLRKGAVRRFMVAFLEALYRLNRLPLMLVVDEADDICPQKPFGDEAQMVGAMEDVVKRGRKKGLGCTLITQRPADLAKQVLTQCEVLVAMRLVHPLDIKAVMEWVHVHADTARARQMVESLPSLPIGTAWFWSPGFGDIFERVTVRKRLTFDSSATPKPGEKVITPKQLAQADLTKLGAEISASLERAKANDPAALKARVRELESQLAKKEAPVPTPPREIKVPDVVVLRDLRIRLQEIESIVGSVLLPLNAQIEVLTEIRTNLAATTQTIARSVQPIAGSGARPGTAMPVRAPVSPTRSAPASGTGSLAKAERRVLAVLAQHGACEKGKLALLSGYTYSGGFRNILSSLRTAGLLVGGNEEVMNITDAGSRALGDFEPLPTGRALADYWLNSSLFGTGERVVLQALLDEPNGYSAQALAGAAGYEYSGGFRNILSALRTAGVIVGKNTDTIRVNPDLLG